MPETDLETNNINIIKTMWPLYTLAGCFSVAFSGIFILVVPLSSLFWPGEPFHAIEMGILITMMLWVTSIAGIIFGRIIDNHKFKRTKILFIVAISRGVCMIMLSFATEGKGMET